MRFGSLIYPRASPPKLSARKGSTTAARQGQHKVGFFFVLFLALSSLPMAVLMVRSRDDLEVTTNLQQISKSSKNLPTIAYAISLIKCGDFQSSTAGLLDAAIVLRHSVHATHQHSKYNYRMVALVHRQAVDCSHLLRDVGFDVVVVDAPVQPNDIQGEHLRQNVHKEWCCGHDEFIKLQAYNITNAPIVVHVDIDFAFFKPMDDLFDAILYDKDSPQGKAARARIPLERPQEGFPDRIQAFVTRDWPQVIPGKKAGYQAGFLVARRDPSVTQELIDIVKKGDFRQRGGWGGGGYGGFVGAMAMQGLIAYYYDMVRPNTAVELNQCRFNWMGMDTKYRNHPKFRPNHPKVGHCRNDRDYCEDCINVDPELIYNVHYTQCRKPWNCIGVGHPGGRAPGAGKASAIDTNTGAYELCMKVVKQWHEYRSEFESQLYEMTQDKKILTGSDGQHKREVFNGHCAGEGGKNYKAIAASPESLKLVPKLYL